MVKSTGKLICFKRHLTQIIVVNNIAALQSCNVQRYWSTARHVTPYEIKIVKILVRQV